MADEVFRSNVSPVDRNIEEAKKNLAPENFSAELNKISVVDNNETKNLPMEDKIDKNNISNIANNSEKDEQSLKRNTGAAISDDEDTKLKQNDNGTLISRGDEFGADDNTSFYQNNDNSLTSLQDHSDIRFFICGTCKNNPILIGSTPKLLPCLHSFCENCLQERYDKQKNLDPKNTSPRLKCPSCGQEFLVSGNDRPTSGFLNNQFVIESTPSPKQDTTENHQCTSCDDKSSASSYCMNCNEWLCDTCVRAHQRVKVTKDHIIQEKSSSDTNRESRLNDNGLIKEKPLFCKVHPSEQLKLFCANCDKLTCRDCQLVEHKDHRYQFIDEAALKHREILKKLLQYLQINLGLLKETISEVEKVSSGLSDQGRDLEAEIERSFDSLIASIKSRQSAVIKELRSLVTNRQALLAKQKKDLTQMRIILEHNHDFADFAVKGGSNVALLYSRKVLGTRLHNLNSLKYRQRPLATTDLKFSMDVEKLCSYFNKMGAVFSQEDMQRKIDHYNSKSSSATMQRTMALTSSRTYGRNTTVTGTQNPLDSMNAINKRITETTTSANAGYINLSKYGSLGLPGHQTIRNNAVSPQNPNIRHQSQSSQDMIVLSSGTSPKAISQNEMALLKRDYTAKYLNQLKEPVPSAHTSSRTPVNEKAQSSFYGVNREGQRDLSKASNSQINRSHIETSSPSWTKNENSINSKGNNTTLDQLRKMVEGSTPNFDNNVERPKSTKSSASDPGQSANGIVIKQESKSPDGRASYQLNSSSQDDMRSESGFDEGQNNEDYCGVCRNGGQLLCCDTCPKVYHLHCHIPALSDLPRDSWSCGLCSNIGHENKHITGQKRRFLEQLTEWEIKLCEKICLHLFVHQDSPPFHHKVNKSEAPDYYKVISNPMDLKTVVTKLNPNHFQHYRLFQDFIADIRLIFSNCVIYNAADSDVCKMGRRLEGYFDTLLTKYVPDVNHYPENDIRKRRKEDNLSFN